MNILIINQPLNNRGDESAHKALIRALVQAVPNATISVLFINKPQEDIDSFDVQKQQVHYINLKLIYFKVSLIAIRTSLNFILKIFPATRKILNIYRSADLVICAPGGICMGGFQDWGHLIYLMYAKYLKKPLIYYGRSFGPFPEQTAKNRLFKRISLKMLHYFSFCAIRDKETEALAKKIGINYTSTVDTAFLDSPQENIPSEITTAIGSQNYIIFVPNLLIWHYAYKNRLSKKNVLLFFSKIYNCIAKQYPSHKIVLLPQTFNYKTYDKDDINFFQELAAYISKPNLIVLPDSYGSDIQQTLIASSTCVIGARYHSIVFAINQGVPFVALSYEHKIKGLLKTLNKESYMLDITSALEDENRMNSAIINFKNILKYVSPDATTKRIAKQMARTCFNKFLTTQLNISKQ